jgi:hypothetical protein
VKYFPEHFPRARGAGAPRAKNHFSTILDEKRTADNGRLAARTNAYSLLQRRNSIPLTWLAQRVASGPPGCRLWVQIQSDPHYFVFALFNLFSRNQCSALQHRSVIQIEHVHLHFATTNMRLLKLLGLETTRYSAVYVKQNIGGFALESSKGLARGY